ncbi:MAG: cob(I)yrinic acid a,c-diamide adenosyltransferase [bacterium]
MLYTRKGDNGTTGIFGCDQRISKSSNITEALGSLDEVNSFLGLVKVKCNDVQVGVMKILDTSFAKIVSDIQQNLFIIQAEVAGSRMSITEEKLKECENYANEGERLLPPIKTFFVSGGTEIASIFDISRTLARKAERRVVSVAEETLEDKRQEISHLSLSYLNRLSSLLYVMARLANHNMGLVEEVPNYK